MIRLNGTVWVNDDEYIFDDFEVKMSEDSEDLGLPFDFFVDDEEDYCDDCVECDCFENDDDDDIDELVDTLTDVYAEELSDLCLCNECVKDLLKEFLQDFIDL